MGSCADTPSDGINRINYGNLRIGKMDLSGAKSIGFKSKDGTRAIDGEYVSAGMYKVDENGNISAVAVYFTTDTLGNRLEHEEKLRIVPSHLENLTENYFMVTDCSYYDSDNDLVKDKWEYDEATDESTWIQQDVPYKNLLVRKSDGKIWCIDNIIDQICSHGYGDYSGKYYCSLEGIFIQSNHGDLYFTHKYRRSFKFNLSGDYPSFEQITTGDGMPSNNSREIIVTDSGIVGAYRQDRSDGYGLELYFGWPHSGFTRLYGDEQYFDLLSKDFPDFDIEDLTVIRHYQGKHTPYITDFRLELKSFSFKMLNKNNTIYLIVYPTYEVTALYHMSIEDERYSDVRHGFVPANDEFHTPTAAECTSKIKEASQNNLPNAVFYRIEPGSEPGDINFTKLSSLMNPPATEVNFSYNLISPKQFQCVWDGDKLICLGDKWIFNMDLNDSQWKYVKEYNIEDGSKIPRYNFTYNGKLWYIDTNRENFGAYWFDPNTLEYGFIKFPAIPIFVSINTATTEKDGYVHCEGVDPATSNKVNIWINITTGEMLDEITAPEMMFETIIPLN